MENISQYIYEIKETLLNSPIRQRLSQKEIVPFKDIVSENLNPAVKCGTYHFSDFQAVSSISICNIILPP